MAKINSRSKGQRAERELVKRFSAWWGTEFFRTPLSGGLATMGHSFKGVEIHGDISTSDEANFPFCVECKHHEKWDFSQLWNEKNIIEKWWSQACDQAKVSSKKPLLVFKKNNGPFYAAFIASALDPKVLIPYNTIKFNGTRSKMTIILLEDFFKIPKETWL